MDISLFTQRLRLQFLQAQTAVAQPAPIMTRCVTVVPSEASIENYPWMFPPPKMKEYLGKRQWGGTQQIKYSVPNKAFDAGIEIAEMDIDDDLVGGYETVISRMTLDGGAPFEARTVLGNLANGGTILGFDGSNFFGTTHKLGSTASSPPSGFGGGGNDLTFTSTNSADGNTYRFIVLMHTDQQGIVKPLLFQNREPLSFITDAGTPQARIANLNHYLVRRRCAPAFGFWWDALRITITNYPSLIDIFNCLDAAMQMLYNFQLPINVPTDAPQRVHEQVEFNERNATIVCDNYLHRLMLHAVRQQHVGVQTPPVGTQAGFTDNIYYNMAGIIPSGYLNTH
ncbi:MAG: Mu-like prophage major head subunit gpT family protein [Candidatus Omnitrophica bacterium]|nr:Mu-like prophage major head subunit gpT family protein [Candidatus Omnitrophota bacterium]